MLNHHMVKKTSGSILLFVLFFFIALLVQYPGLNAPMYYDSAGWIEQQRPLFASGSLLKVMELFPQRPLPMATFWLNFRIADMNPVPFRVVNIALSAIASVLFFHLLISVPNRCKFSRNYTIAGLFTAAAFLLHPIQEFTTLYIWQRSALMSCLFSIGALLVYVKTRNGQITRAALGYSSCFAFFLLALFSKENSIVVPVLLILSDLAFFRERFRNHLVRASTYCFLALLAALVISHLERAHGNIASQPGIRATVTQYYLESGISFFEQISFQSETVFQYLSMLLWPASSNVQLLLPIDLGSHSFLGLAGVIGLGILGILLLIKRPISGFGILFFLVSLLPEAILVPQYQFFAYRAILPMVGLGFVIFDFISAVFALPRLGRAMVQALLIAALGVLAYNSHIKANIWADPIQFWTGIVNTFPNTKRMEVHPAYQALHNLGLAYQYRGNYEAALPFLERASQFRPQEARTVSAWAKSLQATGRRDQADILLGSVIEKNPTYVPAYVHLADSLLIQNKDSEAERIIENGLQKVGENEALLDTLGRIHFHKGNEDSALDFFNRALKLNPRYYVTLTNAAALLTNKEDYKRAEQLLTESQAINPQYWLTMQAWGILYASQGDLDKAIDKFQVAIRLNPNDLNLRHNLELALKHKSDTEKQRR